MQVNSPCWISSQSWSRQHALWPEFGARQLKMDRPFIWEPWIGITKTPSANIQLRLFIIRPIKAGIHISTSLGQDLLDHWRECLINSLLVKRYGSQDILSKPQDMEILGLMFSETSFMTLTTFNLQSTFWRQLIEHAPFTLVLHLLMIKASECSNMLIKHWTFMTIKTTQVMDPITPNFQESLILTSMSNPARTVKQEKCWVR